MKFVKTILLFSVRLAAVLAVITGMTVLATLGFVESRFGGKNRINLPPASQHFSPEKKSFKVAVFGDFAMQSGVFVPILHDIDGRKFDFAVSIGDMMRRPIGGEGEFLLECLEENLSTPLVTVVGNHDVVAETGDFSVYRRCFGQTDYYFGYGDTLFIVLDDAMLNLRQEQLDWLDGVLKTTRSLYSRCVIFMHVPPVAYSGDTLLVKMPWSGDFYNVIKKYGVNAIVSGHLHVAAQFRFEDVPVFISPSSGQKIRDAAHPYFGYMELVFSEDGSISPDYHYFPELKRGRSHFLCAIMNYFPGNKTFFYGSILLVIAGAAGLFFTRRRQPKAE